ncbi:MAG: REP-associated tyrosine transposase [Planktothrix sp.]
MPRRKLVFQPEHYYHIYNRGNNRQDIFFERDNYIHFLRQLKKYLIENNTADIIAYCLMPNHYHLLIYLKTDKFSQLMQAFTLSYTKAINKRYQKVGSLFQGPFQAIHVHQDEYLIYLTRYIHLNPVKANIVEKPEDWEFSSYPEYLELRQGTIPQLDRVRSQFQSVENYRDFVENSHDNSSIQHLTFNE